MKLVYLLCSALAIQSKRHLSEDINDDSTDNDQQTDVPDYDNSTWYVPEPPKQVDVDTPSFYDNSTEYVPEPEPPKVEDIQDFFNNLTQHNRDDGENQRRRHHKHK